MAKVDNSKPKAKRGRKPKVVVSDCLSTETLGEGPPLATNVDDNTRGVVAGITHPSVIMKLMGPELSDKNVDEEQFSTLMEYDPLLTIPSGYNKDENFSSIPLGLIENVERSEESRKNSACYWCCHHFNNMPIGIPIKYINSSERFIVTGVFCSLECASAFNFSMNYNLCDIWESQNLLNLMALNMGYKLHVKPAPPRTSLKMFGGAMEIDEFRNFCTSSKYINVINYPMITGVQQIEEISDSNLSTATKGVSMMDKQKIQNIEQTLRLARKKPVHNIKHTLETTMNIQIS
jgi:hypothetical protein